MKKVKGCQFKRPGMFTPVGLWLVNGNDGLVGSENLVEPAGGDSVDKAICRGTCALGGSKKSSRVCVDVGGDKPLVFGKQRMSGARNLAGCSVNKFINGDK